MLATQKSMAGSSGSAVALLVEHRPFCRRSNRRGAASPATPPLTLDRKTFVPGEGAWWKLVDMEGVLKFFLTDVYIAAPAPNQDATNGSAPAAISRGATPGPAETGRGALPGIDRGGFRRGRAWVRLADDAARSYALRPGDKLAVDVEARWLQGNSNLCGGPGLRACRQCRLVGWSGVLTTLPVPRTGNGTGWQWS